MTSPSSLSTADHTESIHLPVPSSVPRSESHPDDSLNKEKGDPPVTPRTKSFTSSILRKLSTRGHAIVTTDSGDLEDAPPTPTAPWSRGADSGPVVDKDNKSGPGIAGNPAVYSNANVSNMILDRHPIFDKFDLQGPPFRNHIIRERVSTQGVIRPLEPEEDLPACNVPFEMIGVINEAATKRYLQGQAMWDKKYSHVTKTVARHRERNLKNAGKESIKIMNQLHRRLSVNPSSLSSRSSTATNSQSASGSFASSTNAGTNESGSVSRGESITSSSHLLNSPLWSWTWALEGENPPPSSIVARRDTSEARRLSKSADMHLDEDESRMSGNNLWAIVMDFLSATSGSTSVESKTVPGAEDQDERPASDGGVAEAGMVDDTPPTPNGHSAPSSPKSLRSRRSFGTLFRRFKGKNISSVKANELPRNPNGPSPLSPGISSNSAV